MYSIFVLKKRCVKSEDVFCIEAASRGHVAFTNIFKVGKSMGKENYARELLLSRACRRI